MSPSSKILMIIAISAIVLGCNSSSPVEDMRWLEGNWKQINHTDSRMSLETWLYKEGELIGKGYMVTSDNDHYDTIFSEDLRIIVREQELFYEADLPTQEPVLYRLKDQDNNKWSFANPLHDSPKFITYEKTDKGFNATVSDEKRAKTLEFVKL